MDAEKETEVEPLCVPLPLRATASLCASMCAFIRASMRLYVPLCVPLLARATAWLPDSAWESAFTAPPCSTRPRQACPFLPLQRQYNHQMTKTTQFFNKPQDHSICKPKVLLCIYIKYEKLSLVKLSLTLSNGKQ